MLDLSGLLLVLLFGVGGYYAFTAIKLKETAQRAVEIHCANAGVQLLDGTVFLRKFRFARDSRGNPTFKREFQFEFTATGEDRNRGWIRLIGSRVMSIELAPHRFQ